MRSAGPSGDDGARSFGADTAVSFYAAMSGLQPKEEVAFAFLPSQGRILDLGCGAGRTTAVLSRRGHEVIGVDIARAMVAAASVKVPKVSFLTADAARLPFARASFAAVVFSFNGLDYLYPESSRSQALKEIHRLLKPGGVFIFSTHNNCVPRGWDGLAAFARGIFRGRHSTYIRDTSIPSEAVLTHLTTPAEQLAQLTAHGFELIKLVPRRALCQVRSLTLIGLIDTYCYYVARKV